jgi:general stress protein 26
MWLDWFIEHFPGGMDDPNYCILEFTAAEATLWIDREFVTLEVD